VEQEQKFLASLFPNVAAQLRVPLGNLYLSAAQLVPAAVRENDPRLDQKAAIMDKSYYQMLRLINNLSMAAYLTDETPLPVQDRDIVDLVGDVCDKAGDLAGNLGLNLRFICAPESHICAVAQEATEQLLYHLLSNAFKFTPAGGTVSVELRFSGKRILLSVSDTGCGISPERLPTLFDRYLQAGQMDLPVHGLGLGLPLCQSIAKRQGGTLMAESRVGEGSRFTLSLPDRQVGGSVSDVPFDYAGGFNRTLLALADALPAKAFLLRNQGRDEI